MAVKFDRVGFRKIETYLGMRKKLLYTAHAVGSRGSERCEREVSGQKSADFSRLGPLLCTFGLLGFLAAPRVFCPVGGSDDANLEKVSAPEAA